MQLRKSGNKRRVRKALMLLSAVSVALGVLVPVQPAHAFFTFGRYPAETICYNEQGIRNVIGQVGIDSLYASDWAWEVEELWKWTNLVANNGCTTSRNLYFAWGDGFGGTLGQSNGACGSGSSCYIWFDLYDRWNSTWEYRDNNWVDFRTVSLHEFGHWIGLAHSYDSPSTDNRSPIMQGWPSGGHNYGDIQRSIVQDDVNSFHAARNYATIISADDSFEYHGWFYWDFHYRVPGQGSGTLYCGGGQGYAGTNCFIEYNGAGNSVYQDMAIRTEYVNYRTMVGRARFRNRTGAPASVTVAVWNLENGQVFAQQVCNLPLDTSWIQCATPGFTSDGRYMRLESYNNTGGNVDIDTAILG